MTCISLANKLADATKNYPRASALPVGVVTTIGGACDTIGGIVAGALAIIPSFFSSNARKLAREGARHVMGSRCFLSDIYAGILHTCNPNAKINDTYNQESYCSSVANTIINHNGIITRIFQTGTGKDDGMENFIKEANRSKSFVVRQIGSRFLALGTLLGSIVTRVIDFIIGIFALLASIVTLGKWDKANEYAYRGLQITGIISDVYIYGMKFINPRI